MDVEPTGAARTCLGSPPSIAARSFMPRSPRPVVPGWPSTPSSITSTLTWLGSVATRTLARAPGPACLRTLVSAS